MIGLRLGLADLRAEPVMFLCHAAALCAVVAPLLVLAGLRVGVVGALLGEMRDDPSNRRVLVRGDHAFTAADIARIAALPGIGFLLPMSRSIAARGVLDLEERGASQRTGLLPSGAGDPLLPGRPALMPEEAALSDTLMRRLGIAPGATVILRNARTDGSEAVLRLPLRVVAAVRDDWLAGAIALVHPEVLDRMEAFLDGFAIPELDIPGRDPAERHDLSENVRLYAADIGDVIPLTAALRSGFGVEVHSEEERIRQIQALDRNLLLILGLVTAVAAAGLTLSFAAQVWAGVERKRSQLCILRLLGAGRGALASFPVAQTLATVLAGFGAALLAYRGLALGINATFAGLLPKSAPPCRLAPEDLAAAAAATLLAGLLASAAAGWRASRLPPAEGIAPP